MTYTRNLIEILERLDTQSEVLDTVAAKCAEAVRTGGLIHLYGSGHSVIPTMDAFPRYGSFAGLHPLTDPRLMWHNVLGPGGVRELLWLERTEGYVEQYLDHEPISEGDVLIVYSHGGRNAAPVEAAMYGVKRGLFTVAVTSRANLDRPAEHSSGRRIAEICDVTVDTGVPVQDAIVEVDGWDRPVGGASTVVACVVSHEIVTRTAAALAAQGVVVPTFVSPTVPGATVSSNDEVFADHRLRLHNAEARGLA
ncbi:SIS domain-containing protein [Spongiactinospora sp. TRM90649]|uniref:SIS domain-containing protein n=1 Tax=Spongiactinospora sp. TRM90649 TaxID=3031114 RepID=UPI0023F72C9A|nr:SIS domain-containing protein [Spongiactinospora sp. TRM90649]MDF5756234.1 SIS domain-containing protein [Spongiactinospora sp. TRM90649]